MGDSKKMLQVRSARQVPVRVQLLDDELFEHSVDKRAVGWILFDKVCEHLNILEKDYFGLNYVDATGIKYWVNNDKKISKQMKGQNWDFKFEVKFYQPDPAQLAEDLTRYQLCLQIRRDIVNEKLPCSFVTYTLLGSYTAQSELGDYDTEEFGSGYRYLKDIQFAPHQDKELLVKIAELHRQHKGQTPEEAELHFLENAKKLAMYGVEIHQAKDAEGKDITLGVGAQGLIVYKDKQQINRFVWPKVLKISYRRNKYYIKIRPGEFETFASLIGFKLLNVKMAKRLWKISVEHHSFFRFREAEPIKSTSLIPRFGSRFRYSGRTQFQTRQIVAEENRESPYFDRVLSKRGTFAGRTTNMKKRDEDRALRREDMRRAPPVQSPQTKLPPTEPARTPPEPTHTPPEPKHAPPVAPKPAVKPKPMPRGPGSIDNVSLDREPPQSLNDSFEDVPDRKSRMEKMHAVATPLAQIMQKNLDKNKKVEREDRDTRPESDNSSRGPPGYTTDDPEYRYNHEVGSSNIQHKSDDTNTEPNVGRATNTPDNHHNIDTELDLTKYVNTRQGDGHVKDRDRKDSKDSDCNRYLFSYPSSSIDSILSRDEDDYDIQNTYINKRCRTHSEQNLSRHAKKFADRKYSTFSHRHSVENIYSEPTEGPYEKDEIDNIEGIYAEIDEVKKEIKLDEQHNKPLIHGRKSKLYTNNQMSKTNNEDKNDISSTLAHPADKAISHNLESQNSKSKKSSKSSLNPFIPLYAKINKKSKNKKQADAIDKSDDPKCVKDNPDKQDIYTQGHSRTDSSDSNRSKLREEFKMYILTPEKMASKPIHEPFEPNPNAKSNAKSKNHKEIESHSLPTNSSHENSFNTQTPEMENRSRSVNHPNIERRHYVNEELPALQDIDEGPSIEQAKYETEHDDSIKDITKYNIRPNELQIRHSDDRVANTVQQFGGEHSTENAYEAEPFMANASKSGAKMGKPVLSLSAQSVQKQSETDKSESNSPIDNAMMNAPMYNLLLEMQENDTRLAHEAESHIKERQNSRHQVEQTSLTVPYINDQFEGNAGDKYLKSDKSPSSRLSPDNSYQKAEGSSKMQSTNDFEQLSGIKEITNTLKGSTELTRPNLKDEEPYVLKDHTKKYSDFPTQNVQAKQAYSPKEHNAADQPDTSFSSFTSLTSLEERPQQSSSPGVMISDFDSDSSQTDIKTKLGCSSLSSLYQITFDGTESLLGSPDSIMKDEGIGKLFETQAGDSGYSQRLLMDNDQDLERYSHLSSCSSDLDIRYNDFITEQKTQTESSKDIDETDNKHSLSFIREDLDKNIKTDKAIESISKPKMLKPLDKVHFVKPSFATEKVLKTHKTVKSLNENKLNKEDTSKQPEKTNASELVGTKKVKIDKKGNKRETTFACEVYEQEPYSRYKSKSKSSSNNSQNTLSEDLTTDDTKSEEATMDFFTQPTIIKELRDSMGTSGDEKVDSSLSKEECTTVDSKNDNTKKEITSGNKTDTSHNDPNKKKVDKDSNVLLLEDIENENTKLDKDHEKPTVDKIDKLNDNVIPPFKNPYWYRSHLLPKLDNPIDKESNAKSENKSQQVVLQEQTSCKTPEQTLHCNSSVVKERKQVRRHLDFEKGTNSLKTKHSEQIQANKTEQMTNDAADQAKITRQTEDINIPLIKGSKVYAPIDNKAEGKKGKESEKKANLFKEDLTEKKDLFSGNKKQIKPPRNNDKKGLKPIFGLGINESNTLNTSSDSSISIQSDDDSITGKSKNRTKKMVSPGVIHMLNPCPSGWIEGGLKPASQKKKGIEDIGKNTFVSVITPLRHEETPLIKINESDMPLSTLDFDYTSSKPITLQNENIDTSSISESADKEISDTDQSENVANKEIEVTSEVLNTAPKVDLLCRRVWTKKVKKKGKDVQEILQKDDKDDDEYFDKMLRKGPDLDGPDDNPENDQQEKDSTDNSTFGKGPDNLDKPHDNYHNDQQEKPFSNDSTFGKDPNKAHDNSHNDHQETDSLDDCTFELQKKYETLNDNTEDNSKYFSKTEKSPCIHETESNSDDNEMEESQNYELQMVICESKGQKDEIDINNGANMNRYESKVEDTLPLNVSEIDKVIASPGTDIRNSNAKSVKNPDITTGEGLETQYMVPKHTDVEVEISRTPKMDYINYTRNMIDNSDSEPSDTDSESDSDSSQEVELASFEMPRQVMYPNQANMLPNEQDKTVQETTMDENESTESVHIYKLTDDLGPDSFAIDCSFEDVKSYKVNEAKTNRAADQSAILCECVFTDDETKATYTEENADENQGIRGYKYWGCEDNYDENDGFKEYSDEIFGCGFVGKAPDIVHDSPCVITKSNLKCNQRKETILYNKRVTFQDNLPVYKSTKNVEQLDTNFDGFPKDPESEKMQYLENFMTCLFEKEPRNLAMAKFDYVNSSKENTSQNSTNLIKQSSLDSYTANQEVRSYADKFIQGNGQLEKDYIWSFHSNATSENVSFCMDEDETVVFANRSPEPGVEYNGNEQEYLNIPEIPKTPNNSQSSLDGMSDKKASPHIIKPVTGRRKKVVAYTEEFALDNDDFNRKGRDNKATDYNYNQDDQDDDDVFGELDFTGTINSNDTQELNKHHGHHLCSNTDENLSGLNFPGPIPHQSAVHISQCAAELKDITPDASQSLSQDTQKQNTNIDQGQQLDDQFINFIPASSKILPKKDEATCRELNQLKSEYADVSALDKNNKQSVELNSTCTGKQTLKQETHQHPEPEAENLINEPAKNSHCKENVTRYTYKVTDDSNPDSPKIKSVTYEYVTEYKLNNVKINYQHNQKIQTDIGPNSEMFGDEINPSKAAKLYENTDTQSVVCKTDSSNQTENYNGSKVFVPDISKPLINDLDLDTKIEVEEVMERTVCYPLGPIGGFSSLAVDETDQGLEIEEEHIEKTVSHPLGNPKPKNTNSCTNPAKSATKEQGYPILLKQSKDSKKTGDKLNLEMEDASKHSYVLGIKGGTLSVVGAEITEDKVMKTDIQKEENETSNGFEKQRYIGKGYCKKQILEHNSEKYVWRSFEMDTGSFKSRWLKNEDNDSSRDLTVLKGKLQRSEKVDLEIDKNVLKENQIPIDLVDTITDNGEDPGKLKKNWTLCDETDDDCPFDEYRKVKPDNETRAKDGCVDLDDVDAADGGDVEERVRGDKNVYTAVMQETLPHLSIEDTTNETLFVVQAMAVIALGTVLVFILPYMG